MNEFPFISEQKAVLFIIFPSLYTLAIDFACLRWRGLEEYVQMAAMNMLAPSVSRCPPPLMHIYGCGQDVDQLESRWNSHSVSPPMAGDGRMEVVEIMYVIDL